MNVLTTCPLCNGKDLKVVYRFADFHVLRCSSCKNSWRSNMYDQDKIFDMYCSESYGDHPYFKFDPADLDALSTVRLQNYAQALSWLEANSPGRQLLDVACGSGVFLAMANRRGWQVSGIELSPVLCNACEKNTTIKVLNSRFEDAELSSPFDVITFWDIIEHVLDPISCLRKVRSMLKPGGFVLFCTPDEDSLLAQTGRGLYKLSAGRYSYPALALHPPYHTYFFSRKGFAEILRREGFQVHSTYSQEAYFEHSPLASQVQKVAISLLEKAGKTVDSCYEFVTIAQLKPEHP
jgi:SAM-dependent methyltransferase